MAQTTGSGGGQDAADLAAAVRDRGMEQLEGAKGQLADGAERIAAAVERTSDELDGEGDGALSGFGHSVATLMRQLAGGLRERDVDEFARELGALARRNPGVFLAGSVAVGFGIARFFKARTPHTAMRGGDRWHEDEDSRQRSADGLGDREDFDSDESLDLSATRRVEGEGGEGARADAGSSAPQTGSTTDAAAIDGEPNASKSRQAGKQSKGKPQRAASGGSQQSGASQTERPPASAADAGNSTLTGGSGSAAQRGGKS